MACQFMLAPLSSGQLESQFAIRMNPRFNLFVKCSKPRKTPWLLHKLSSRAQTIIAPATVASRCWRRLLFVYGGSDASASAWRRWKRCVSFSSQAKRRRDMTQCTSAKRSVHKFRKTCVGATGPAGPRARWRAPHRPTPHRPIPRPPASRRSAPRRRRPSRAVPVRSAQR
jgi:hypothetical protein